MNKLITYAALFVSLIIFLGCTPNKAGMVFSVDGKEFSDAELLVDNRKVGHFEQMVVKSTGEIYKEGKYIGTDTSSPLIGKEDNYSGTLDFFSVEPGVYHIVFVARSGKRTEVKATIEAGEYYVSYSSEKEKLMWNNVEYKVIPGKVTVVK